MVVAALADRFLPLDQSIDLLNVAFAQQLPATAHHPNKKGKEASTSSSSASAPSTTVTFDVPDRKTGLKGLAELQCVTLLINSCL
jgi:hypothetical protein